MLKDKRDLENALTRYLMKIDKTVVANKKNTQEWYVELYNKYNIPIEMSSDIICLRKDISGYNEFELFAITDVVKSDMIPIYFTPKEIKMYTGMKHKAASKKRVYRIPMIQITEDQYIGGTSVQFLMELRENRLINYNADTQRALEKMLAGGNVIYRPYVNKKAVSEIAAAFAENNFIPNTISLNINMDDEKADYDYYPDEHILEIRDITAFDIFDGYHRYLGMARVWDENHKFDLPMELRITMFSVSKAKQFIFQEDHKTKMKKMDARTYEQNNYGNIVANRVNTDPSSVLRGKVNITDGIISAGYFAEAVEKYYFKDEKNVTRKMVNDVGTKLITQLNEFIDTYPTYLDNEWEKPDIYIAVYGLSKDYGSDKIYLALQNAPVELKKRIRRYQYLHGTYEPIFKEVYENV